MDSTSGTFIKFEMGMDTFNLLLMGLAVTYISNWVDSAWRTDRYTVHGFSATSLIFLKDQGARSSASVYSDRNEIHKYMGIHGGIWAYIYDLKDSFL